MNETDLSDTPATTGTLAIGGTITGRLHSKYDNDWYRVSLTAGTVYIFSMSGEFNRHQEGGISFAPHVVELGIFDLDGERVLTGGGTDYSQYWLQFTALSTGDFFLGVRSETSYGDFTLAAAIQEPDLISSDVNTSGRLAPGETVQAQFEVAGERDWFRFEAEAGKHYRFDSPPASAGDVQAMRVFVLDASGKELDPAFSLEPLISGTYFIAAESNAAGAYSLRARELTDDYTSNRGTTGFLPIGGSASGEIQYHYDSDNFRMSVTAGVLYKLMLTGAPQDMQALSLSFLSYGFIDTARESRATDGTSTTFFKAAVSGDYYVSISGEYLASGTSSSPYTVTAVAELVDDFGDTQAYATPLALGTVINGSIHHSGDRDVLALELTGGTTYGIDFLRTALSPNTLRVDSVSGADGVPLRFSILNDSGFTTITPASSGSYFLRVEGLWNSGSAAPYSVKVAAVVDDYGAAVANAGQLTVGAPALTGRFETGRGDRDWFGVDLEAGQTYWLNFKGTTDRTDASSPRQFDGILKVFDSAGQLLATIDEQSGATNVQVLPFVPAQDGKYFLEVYARSGEIGSYTVSALPGLADDAGGTPQTAATLLENVSFVGRLEVPTDDDTFKLSVVAGHTYIIDVDQRLATGPGGFNDNFNLSASSPQGWVDFKEVGSSRDAHRSIYFEAETTDHYYFTMSQLGDRDQLAYTLTARSVGVDDFAANVRTTGTLPSDGAMQGTISHSLDIDYIKVSVVEGNTYDFQLLGALSGAGTLATAGFGLELVDGRDNAAWYASSSNTYEPWLKYLASTTGDFYLKVTPGGVQSGTYTLTSTNITNDKTGPQVTWSSHPAGSSSAALAADIVIHFDEIIHLDQRKEVIIRDSKGFAIHVLFDSQLKDVQSIAGRVLTLDPATLLMPGMTYTVDLSALTDAAGNNAGAANFSFTTAAPVAVGTAADDCLLGRTTGARIAGGDGIDTVFYAGKDYTFRLGQSGGEFTVTQLFDSASAPDILSGIERVIFFDAQSGRGSAFALDLDGVAGQAYRLYQAAFDRRPDDAGIGYWIAMMDKGISLTDVARGFVNSNEFQSLYGATSTDASFIAKLYANVLHRTPDQEGADFWLNALGSGFTREEILAQFSESPENQDNVAVLTGNGIPYFPYT